MKASVFVTEEMVQRAATLARELAHLFGIKEFDLGGREPRVIRAHA